MKEERLLPDCVMPLLSAFCGCGEPQEAWDWVHCYLNETSEPGRAWPEDGAGIEWFALYMMNHFGYTQHGSNIACAWLTDKGKELLAFLDKYGDDWNEKFLWHDANKVYYGSFND